jgi:glyoxylase-like metal-dependent hydrolase (beta-lactamase superfamily II)
MVNTSAIALDFPFAEAPVFGSVIKVAPGIFWTRIPLPYRLDHVNIYLVEDGDGWTVIDAGISDEVSRAAWQALIGGPLSGIRLTRLIVTHHHPDHIGLAGWLCERFNIPLLTSQTAYLTCLSISLSPDMLARVSGFYTSHGMDTATTARVASDGHRYLKMVTALPPTFIRLVDGDTLSIGGRDFQVLAGNGHAPEHLMLYCESEKVLLVGDQVIAKITPNVSVSAIDPEGDPLGLFVRSLHTVCKLIPNDALILPGHQLPFRGLHIRCNQLLAHHQERCSLILKSCRRRPNSVAELVPVLFPDTVDPHQLGFAFSETFAHVNYLHRARRLARQTSKDGMYRFVACEGQFAAIC